VGRPEVTAAIFAGISEGTWAFLGVLLTNAVILIGLFVRQGRIASGVRDVNRAVNHQPEDHPTLIQRVASLEKASRIGGRHREWEHEALRVISIEIGCVLPDYPDECLDDPDSTSSIMA
jgi:hypothetical protein